MIFEVLIVTHHKVCCSGLQLIHCLCMVVLKLIKHDNKVQWNSTTYFYCETMRIQWLNEGKYICRAILHCSLFHQSNVFYYNTKRFDGYSVIFISGTKMYIDYSTIYSHRRIYTRAGTGIARVKKNKVLCLFCLVAFHVSIYRRVTRAIELHYCRATRLYIYIYI